MQRLFGAGIVFFALVVAADNPATSTVAVAFAYLILLAALMAQGPAAFGRLSSLTGSTTATGGGAGGYHAKP